MRVLVLVVMVCASVAGCGARQAALRACLITEAATCVARMSSCAAPPNAETEEGGADAEQR